MPKVILCETLLKPQEIPYPSETSEETWTVFGATLFSDSFCDCPGFRFRGDCKHVKHANESRCMWHAPLSDGSEWCPNCRHPAREFNFEPEYD